MHLGAVVTVTPACLDSLGAARLLPQMDRCWFHLCVFLRDAPKRHDWILALYSRLVSPARCCREFLSCHSSTSTVFLMSPEQLWGLSRLFSSDLTLSCEESTWNCLCPKATHFLFVALSLLSSCVLLSSSVIFPVVTFT